MKFVPRWVGFDRHLLWVFLGTAVGMLAYEAVKEQIFLGSLDPWHSHAITIFVTAVIATVASVAVRRWGIEIDNKLLESEAKLHGLYELSPLGILLTDAEGRFLESNASFQKMVSYSGDEMKTMRAGALTPKKYAAADAATVHSLHQTGRFGPYEKELTRKNGTLVPVRLSGSLFDGGAGRKFVWAIFEDITESRRREDKLRLAATVFSDSYEGIAMVAADNCFVDVNPAFTRITGYSLVEAVGQKTSLLASGRHQPEFYEGMWGSLHTHGFWQGEILNRRKSGEVYAETLAISVVRDSARKLQHYICVYSDVSQIKARADELGRIANHDTLTGLPNRRLLSDRLSQAMAGAKRRGTALAVCYIDLDGFKAVNDLHGHVAGDKVLVDVSRRLVSMLRMEDTFARVGGDEFVFLISDLDPPQLSPVLMDRIIEAIRRPVDIGTTQVQVSASIGFTIYPNDDGDGETLLGHADQAMYLAKQAGKNQYQRFKPEA